MPKTAAKPKTARITIWVPCYRPFIMGGDVNRPVKCEIEAQGPFDIGKGFKAYLVSKPGGRFAVAEATTGAIVGDTLEEVRADIKDGSAAVMRKQVAESAIQVARAFTVEPDEFWSLMKGA